jgi:hypothetical protein
VKRNDEEHIIYAESALYRAGIPFLLLLFRQNRFASNTFMVRNIGAARLCLHRAGFRVNPPIPDRAPRTIFTPVEAADRAGSRGCDGLQDFRSAGLKERKWLTEEAS